MRVLQFRWPVVVVQACATGCLPYTVSGVAESCAIVVVPFVLGFLISRWWLDSSARLTLSVALPLFGAMVRLFSSSLHDGTNWFGALYRHFDTVGLGSPYLRQKLLTLLFPMFVTITAVVMFSIFQRRAYAKDA